MNKSFLIVFGVACLPLIAVGQASPVQSAKVQPSTSDLPPSSGQIVEEIITRVNGQIITLSEFERTKDQLKDDGKQHYPENADKIYADL